MCGIRVCLMLLDIHWKEGNERMALSFGAKRFGGKNLAHLLRMRTPFKCPSCQGISCYLVIIVILYRFNSWKYLSKKNSRYYNYATVQQYIKFLWITIKKLEQKISFEILISGRYRLRKSFSYAIYTHINIALQVIKWAQQKIMKNNCSSLYPTERGLFNACYK